MASTLQENGGFLVERLGSVTLKFRVSVDRGAMAWTLEHISVCGVSLPLAWFRIYAKINFQNGCYHFAVNAELRVVGPLVRYEGLLDAAA